MPWPAGSLPEYKPDIAVAHQDSVGVGLADSPRVRVLQYKTGAVSLSCELRAVHTEVGALAG